MTAATEALRATLEQVRSAWWAFVLVPLILAALVATLSIVAPEDPTTVGVLMLVTVIASTSVAGSIVIAHGLLLWIRRAREPSTRSLRPGQPVLAYAVALLVAPEITTAITPERWLERVPHDGMRPAFWCLGIVVIAAVAGVEASLEQLRRRARRSEHLARRRHHAAVQAEMAALQARTQPHFLFNSLSLISTLIDEAPDQAQIAVDRLSGLLRYAMRGAQAGEVELALELDAVRDYLQLQSMRFGPRLRYRIECPCRLEHASILPMTIQPLVENSVNHGVARRRDGASIDVTVQHDGSCLEIVVSDDGPGVESGATPGSAHENLRNRLELHYGSHARFDVGGDDSGYSARLRIPLRHGGVDELDFRPDCR